MIETAWFRTRSVRITATRWRRNGDHPLDGPLGGEGRLVRYFRHPDQPGQELCNQCEHSWNRHGWIDSGDEGRNVCPGDWIVEVDDEYYPVHPDLFDALVEEVPR